MKRSADTGGMGIALAILLLLLFALAPVYGVDTRDGKRQI
jgi:hypothetical protein